MIGRALYAAAACSLLSVIAVPKNGFSWFLLIAAAGFFFCNEACRATLGNKDS